MKNKPKKSLGQNFLIDKNIINLIVDFGKINQNDTVLEVGPGTGNLTQAIISKKPKKLFVVEKDKNLALNLEKKFKNNITIINDDILEFNENDITNKPMTIYGNLPYNISTQILSKWIKNNNFNNIAKNLILMFQKEVADRIIADTNEKNYGRLSILSCWKMKIKKIVDINPKSFYPPPKIKSTVLFFEPKKKYFKLNNPRNLEHITRVFFNQKRKMIKKPLKILFKNNIEISNKLGINLNLRPQNLSPMTYFKLCGEYENLSK
jgi:16S rRNA (adenine1518-N6/adenine1519-N6)-dimethyltransferase